jgi:hypothetical protein
MVEAAGIEWGPGGSDTPGQPPDIEGHDESQLPTQHDTYDVVPEGDSGQNRTVAGQPKEASGRFLRGICVGETLPTDLLNVIECWSKLPATVRQAIVLLVQGDE